MANSYLLETPRKTAAINGLQIATLIGSLSRSVDLLTVDDPRTAGWRWSSVVVLSGFFAFDLILPSLAFAVLKRARQFGEHQLKGSDTRPKARCFVAAHQASSR
jgi:hypothetical protein